MFLSDKNTVCFTGHRSFENSSENLRKIVPVVMKLYSRGFRYFITGGALGFDTVCARSVHYLRSIHGDVKFYMVLPFPGYDSKWTDAERKLNDFLISESDEVVYTSHEFSKNSYYIRNRYMVDHSDFVCALYNTANSKSGTGMTVRYAQKIGKPIINLAEYPRFL